MGIYKEYIGDVNFDEECFEKECDKESTLDHRDDFSFSLRLIFRASILSKFERFTDIQAREYFVYFIVSDSFFFFSLYFFIFVFCFFFFLVRSLVSLTHRETARNLTN